MNQPQSGRMAKTTLGLTLLAVVLVVVSCSTTSKPRGEATMMAAFQEGAPGEEVVIRTTEAMAIVVENL